MAKKLTLKYYDDRQQGRLDFGSQYNEFKADIGGRLDTVFNPDAVRPEDARKVREAKFDSRKFELREFQQLWQKINSKTYYTVEFKTEDLVERAVAELDGHLRVSQVSIEVTEGALEQIRSKQALSEGTAMEVKGSDTHTVQELVNENVRYDLVGKLVDGTGLTRRAVVAILQKVKPATINMFKANPEEFIIKAGNIINQCKAIAVIEHVAYHKLDQTFDSDIFSASALKGRLGVNALESRKSLYDLVVVDSPGIEMNFAKELEVKNEVAVYTKLPGKFYINTPAGQYRPDWAIVFNEQDGIKHIYFVAETKGYKDDVITAARDSEKIRIECARRHFAAIAGSKVIFDVVRDYAELTRIITK